MLAFTRRLSCAAAWGILLCVGCKQGNGTPREKERASAENQVDPARSAPDSLILTSGTGVEVWYRLARTSQRSDGARCVERGLEIRRAQQRIQVPLLYTGEKPTLLNDSTIRAILWTNCQPVEAYLVDLASGRPVRQAEAAR